MKKMAGGLWSGATIFKDLIAKARDGTKNLV